MADIRAFRGFRYDLGRVGALADVVAPPYDVIDPALHAALAQRSPYNVVGLLLEPPGTVEGHPGPYAHAAALLRAWRADDVLLQDSARSLYVYHQEFEIEGQRLTRKGFLALVRLEPFGAGHIFPHEEVLPGPRADRLQLLRATGLDLGPVFGLYPDTEGEVMARLDRAVGRALPLEATDHLGVVHRLYPIHDHPSVSAVTGLLSPKPIYLADGHHRYEAALRYRDELRAAGEVTEDGPANFALMALVATSDPGLVILPTHRLVSGLPGLIAEGLAQRLADHFTVEPVGQGEAGAREAWELMQVDGTQELLGFGTADGTWQLARFRALEEMARLSPDHGPTWRGLAVAVLHVLVLDRLLAPAAPACRYVHRLDEVQAAIAGKECDLAVLVPPARLEDVEQIAGAGERMPPKSTYFYPKLLSGLVFHSLRAE